MNYTILPVAAPTFDWFLCALLSLTFSLAFIMIVTLLCAFDVLKTDKQSLNACIISIAVSIVLSFGLLALEHDKKQVPINEPVCGYMVGFDSRTVGKYNQVAGFVQYEMCDGSGIISLRTSDQKSYPKEAIFYKNLE